MIFFSLFFSSISFAAPTILAEFETPYNFEFKKTKIGGLSGLHCEGTKVWAVSDDRGKYGSPRFYEFELKYEKLKSESKPVFSLQPVQLHELKSQRLPKVLDLEAISRSSSGDFLLSSEGDLNKIPRVPPQFLRVDSQGQLKLNYDLPETFVPESTGKQKKGVQNNQAFEAMRWSDKDQNFWAVHESALFQDYNELETIKGDVLHFVRINTEAKLLEDQKYKLEAWSDSEDGKEIMCGVSEILEVEVRVGAASKVGAAAKFGGANNLGVADKERVTENSPAVANSWWVLERGVRLSILGVKYSASLYRLDKDFKKTKVMDFKEAENFEGLCHGPLVDGRETLLMVSDNNFSKREKTKWLLLAVD